MADYEELRALRLHWIEFEKRMNEEFEERVAELLESKGYAVQGTIEIYESNYDFIWEIRDNIYDDKTQERIGRIDTGYVFLPESDEVVRCEEA
ncbi:MAG: hypothetical protein R3Y63_14520 [Eubacteriales bacterium]